MRLFVQVAQRGLTWSSLHESITPDFPFSAARVFIMISIDVVLYAVLALYLDKVSRPGILQHDQLKERGRTLIPITSPCWPQHQRAAARMLNEEH